METLPAAVEEIARHSSPPFRCLNCHAERPDGKLFCSDSCKVAAKFVRYYRACQADGRIKRPDVQEALDIRLAHILGGGYDERSRRLAISERTAIFARDKSLCQICGQPGTQIDHISGSSNDPQNLQVICDPCHRQKTKSGFLPINATTHPGEWARLNQLMARIHVDTPLLICDRPDWDRIWRPLTKARKQREV